MIWLCMQQLQTCVVVFSPPGFAGNRLWAGRFVGQDRSSPVLVFTCWSHLQQAQVALQQASERLPSRAARWVAQGQCHWGFCWPLQLVSCLSASHPAEAWSGQLSYSSFYQRTIKDILQFKFSEAKPCPQIHLYAHTHAWLPPAPSHLASEVGGHRNHPWSTSDFVLGFAGIRWRPGFALHIARLSLPIHHGSFICCWELRGSDDVQCGTDCAGPLPDQWLPKRSACKGMK